MLRKILVSSILLVLLPFTIWCSERAGRPVQLQLVNFSGVALGYHISDSIYLGYTYVSSMDLSLEPQNPRALYGQDYVEKVDVEEDQDQSIELRISPYDSGLYFSVGVLSTGRKYKCQLQSSEILTWIVIMSSFFASNCWSRIFCRFSGSASLLRRKVWNAWKIFATTM